MSNLKTFAAGAAAMVVVVGLLVWSGVLSTPAPLPTEGSVKTDEAKPNAKPRRHVGKTHKGKRKRGRRKPVPGAIKVPKPDRKRQGVFHKVEGGYDPEMLMVVTLLGGSIKGKRGQRLTQVRLIDAAGKVRHHWDPHPFKAPGGASAAMLTADGTLLISHAGRGVARLDWDSKPVWTHELNVHYDVNIDRDGVVLAVAARTVPASTEDGVEVTILDQGIAMLPPTGEATTIWASEAFAEQPAYRARLVALAGGKPAKGKQEPFHITSVDAMPDDPKGRWKAGDLLLAVRDLHMVAVISRQTGQVVWSWSEDDLSPRQATAGPDGHVFVFDTSRKKKRSRILEIDPQTDALVWTYDPTDAPFYSAARGDVQASADGRLAVFSSNRGRAFIVDREGTIGWDFLLGARHHGYVIPVRGQLLHGSLREVALNRLAETPKKAEPSSAEANEGGQGEAAPAEPGGDSPAEERDTDEAGAAKGSKPETKPTDAER